MKRFVHSLFGLLLMLGLVVLAGSIMHYATQGPASWQEFVACMADSREEGIMLGGAILLSVLVYLLSGVSSRRQVDYLTFKGKSGKVSLSIQTVSDYIAQIADEFADVLSMEPRLTPARGTVEVDLDVRVKAGTQIPEMTNLLQERVRAAVKEHVGLFDVKKVKVNIDEIVVSGQPPAKPGEDLDAALSSEDDAVI